jgi:hypothetical protein
MENKKPDFSQRLNYLSGYDSGEGGPAEQVGG